jgi:hypothetical protein
VSVEVTPTYASFLSLYPTRRDRERKALCVKRRREESPDWYVTTEYGLSPLAWGDSAEELVAWVRSEGFRPEVL